jgi:hypothetical protein
MAAIVKPTVVLSIRQVAVAEQVDILATVAMAVAAVVLDFAVLLPAPELVEVVVVAMVTIMPPQEAVLG